MIVDGKNLIVEDLFEAFQIQNHTRNRVRIAFNRNLDHIIVPVTERVCSRAVDALVFRVGQLRRPADVRRREFDLFRYHHFAFDSIEL
jgi:hypothetical protein